MINIKHNGQRAITFRFGAHSLKLTLKPRAYVQGLGYVTLNYNIPITYKK